jgi:hypothetical protein
LSLQIKIRGDTRRNGLKKVDIVSRKEVQNNSFENFLAVFFWPNSRFLEAGPLIFEN